MDQNILIIFLCFCSVLFFFFLEHILLESQKERLSLFILYCFFRLLIKKAVSEAFYVMAPVNVCFNFLSDGDFKSIVRRLLWEAKFFLRLIEQQYLMIVIRSFDKQIISHFLCFVSAVRLNLKLKQVSGK